MSNSLIETYVLFSEFILHPSIFPLNLIIFVIGLFFGMRRALLWLSGAVFPIARRLGGFFRAVLQTKEPLGLYGAILSTLVAFLALISFLQDGEEIELLLRCDRTDQFSASERYVYAAVRCAVKNSGNVTATIDTIEPTFYFSEIVDLQRSREDRSIHSFRGDPNELLSDDFPLPQTLQPGVTKLFDANVAIPIGWYEKKQNGDSEVWTIPDVELLLAEFMDCQKSDQLENCFHIMTGKYIPNYLYETIEYPAGAGGYQPINGIGISVSDFSYSVEIEVDLFSGLYPQQSNEQIELLSDRPSFNHVENLQRPWWKKEYTVWTQVNENSRSGQSTNFIIATIQYFLTIVSVIGWVLIGHCLWRRAFERVHNTGE